MSASLTIARRDCLPFLRHSHEKRETGFPHLKPLQLQNFKDETFGSVSQLCPFPDYFNGERKMKIILIVMKILKLQDRTDNMEIS